MKTKDSAPLQRIIHSKARDERKDFLLITGFFYFFCPFSLRII